MSKKMHDLTSLQIDLLRLFVAVNYWVSLFLGSYLTFNFTVTI